MTQDLVFLLCGVADAVIRRGSGDNLPAGPLGPGFGGGSFSAPGLSQRDSDCSCYYSDPPD